MSRWSSQAEVKQLRACHTSVACSSSVVSSVSSLDIPCVRSCPGIFLPREHQHTCRFPPSLILASLDAHCMCSMMCIHCASPSTQRVAFPEAFRKIARPLQAPSSKVLRQCGGIQALPETAKDVQGCLISVSQSFCLALAASRDRGGSCTEKKQSARARAIAPRTPNRCCQACPTTQHAKLTTRTRMLQLVWS